MFYNLSEMRFYFYIDDKKVLKEKYGEYKVVSFDIEEPEIYGDTIWLDVYLKEDK